MGEKWSWNPRRKRRHDLRRGTSRTLCGRLASQVVLAKAGAPYPKDRSNCVSCGNAATVTMAAIFNRTYRKMQRGELVALPTINELREAGMETRR